MAANLGYLEGGANKRLEPFAARIGRAGVLAEAFGEGNAERARDLGAEALHGLGEVADPVLLVDPPMLAGMGVEHGLLCFDVRRDVDAKIGRNALTGAV